MSIRNRWIDNSRKKTDVLVGACPNATLPTTYPTLFNQVSNASLRGEMPATNRLSDSTVNFGI